MMHNALMFLTPWGLIGWVLALVVALCALSVPAYIGVRAFAPLWMEITAHKATLASAAVQDQVLIIEATAKREAVNNVVLSAGGGDYLHQTLVNALRGKVYVAAHGAYEPRASIATHYAPRYDIRENAPAQLAASAAPTNAATFNALLPREFGFLTRYAELTDDGLLRPGHIYLGDTIRDNALVPVMVPVSAFWHFIAGGPTGAGKSTLGKIAVTQVALECRSAIFALIDPEQKEMHGYGALPQTHYNAQSAHQAVEVLEQIDALRQSRYLLSKDALAQEAPLFLVVDELQTLRDAIGNKQYDGKFANLLRTSRAARIYCIAGAQRPSSGAIGPDVRNNLRTRACFAGTPEEIARSIGFHDARQVRGLQETRGRALLRMPEERNNPFGGTFEVQVPRFEDSDMIKLLGTIAPGTAPATQHAKGIPEDLIPAYNIVREGMGPTELATVMGISKATAHSKLHRLAGEKVIEIEGGKVRSISPNAGRTGANAHG